MFCRFFCYYCACLCAASHFKWVLTLFRFLYQYVRQHLLKLLLLSMGLFSKHFSCIDYLVKCFSILDQRSSPMLHLILIFRFYWLIWRQKLSQALSIDLQISKFLVKANFLFDVFLKINSGFIVAVRFDLFLGFGTNIAKPHLTNCFCLQRVRHISTRLSGAVEELINFDGSKVKLFFILHPNIYKIQIIQHLFQTDAKLG